MAHMSRKKVVRIRGAHMMNAIFDRRGTHSHVRLMLLLKCLQSCFFLICQIYLLGTSLRLCYLVYVQVMCS